MNHFNSSLFYFYNKRKKSEVEKLFLELNRQLEVYEKQFNLTVKSYLSEWKNDRIKLRKNYLEQRSKAEKIYNDVIDNENSDDDISINYALNASGLEYIDFQYNDDKEAIDNKYHEFLDLYSKSILVAVYSMNENTLNNLCEITSKKFDKKIKLSHFSQRDYLKSTFRFLNLVIEIDTSILENYFTKFKDIQYIRNRIVHDGSVFNQKNGFDLMRRNKGMFDYDDNKSYLKIIKSQFIKDLFKLIKNFYHELLWLIEEKQRFEILKDSLKYWFGIIDKNIYIKVENYNRESTNKRNLEIYMSSKKRKVPKLNFNIKICKNQLTGHNIVDKTKNDKINEFTDFENESKCYHLSEALTVFNFSKQMINIQISEF